MTENPKSKMDWQRDDFRISDDRSRLDRDAIHRFLSGSYWATGIPREIVDRSIENSLCFGMYQNGRQIGFARVITDYATFGYLSDVFILESHRGRGLAKWLMEVVLAHPRLAGLRRWVLVTRDAQGLYRRLGFRDLEDASRYMEIVDRNVYARP
jgi:GNAT superfamily N-acetyltransferase